MREKNFTEEGSINLSDMETNLRKNDIILIVALLVIGLGAYLAITLFQGASTKNGTALVTIDGEVYGRFPLVVDATERIELPNGAYNLLVIENGQADIVEASCPDGICVKHRPVSKNGQTIVCLPNKMVVEIENGEASDIDAIAR